MRRSTTWLLLVLVAALGGVAWWQSQREAGGEFDYVERLFEGVDRTSGSTGLRSLNLE